MEITTKAVLATTAGIASILLAAPAATAANGGTPSTTGYSYGYYTDSNDSVRACSYNDYFSAWVKISILQADGSWVQKTPVTSRDGCTDEIRSVEREAGQVRVEVCDAVSPFQGAPRYNCNTIYVNGS